MSPDRPVLGGPERTLTYTQSRSSSLVAASRHIPVLWKQAEGLEEETPSRCRLTGITQDATPFMASR
jgi:hypothetical protein